MNASASEQFCTPLADTPGILVEDLTMIYRPQSLHIEALHQVNLQVPQQSIQMIVGPSGAGKTTLLLILAGILTPTTGRVVLFGQDITRMNRRQLATFRLQHIGMLFQEANLLEALTAQENVEVALELKGIPQRQIADTAAELLTSVGLGDRLHHLPHQLSGGQQLRLGVARAMAGPPHLLIADEPTAALDAENGQIVMTLLHQLARDYRCTVLIATHDPRILKFADQISYLEDGQLRPLSP